MTEESNPTLTNGAPVLEPGGPLADQVEPVPGSKPSERFPLSETEVPLNSAASGAAPVAAAPMTAGNVVEALDRAIEQLEAVCVGCPVSYRVTEDDRKRAGAPGLRPGDVRGATVVRTWPGSKRVNLLVWLDGHNDTLHPERVPYFWVTSVERGDEAGQWQLI